MDNNYIPEPKTANDYRISLNQLRKNLMNEHAESDSFIKDGINIAFDYIEEMGLFTIDGRKIDG